MRILWERAFSPRPPPRVVFMEVGLAGAFWLNILLTLLGFLPGVAHALYVILTR